MRNLVRVELSFRPRQAQDIWDLAQGKIYWVDREWIETEQPNDLWQIPLEEVNGTSRGVNIMVLGVLIPAEIATVIKLKYPESIKFEDFDDELYRIV
jgi:hypothetical protein